MCTLSWRTRSEGYEICFNRDELRSRAIARPPDRHSAQAVCGEGGLRYLAPTDPAGGGTWIAVNSAGLTLCLLNGYMESNHAEGADFRSRGLLISDLADCRNVAEVARCLPERLAGTSYRSFILAAFARSSSPRAWQSSGTGETLEEIAAQVPMSSSSRDPVAAARLRRDLLSTLSQESDDALLALHRSHDGGPRALTPCMHRSDSRTVSLTHVRISSATATMEYAAGPPCRTPLGEPLTLDLDP